MLAGAWLSDSQVSGSNQAGHDRLVAEPKSDSSSWNTAVQALILVQGATSTEPAKNWPNSVEKVNN